METAEAWMTRLVNALRTRVRRSGARGTVAPTGPERNFTQERESDRTEQMSADDRAWESESKDRDRKSRAHDQHPSGESR